MEMGTVYITRGALPVSRLDNEQRLLHMALQWISDQVQLILIHPLLNFSGLLVGGKKNLLSPVSGETLI